MSTGLRSTRATARHLDVSDDGTLCASERVFVWKAHLAFAVAGSRRHFRQVYSDTESNRNSWGFNPVKGKK